jgi:beta-ribofuranosylaminobenzene 5'-phosphate synthase
MIHLTAYARLHLGLLDLGHATHAAYGGAGFTLAAPSTVVEATPASEMRIDGPGQDDAVLARAMARLRDEYGVCAVVTVRNAAPRHQGLGSTTTLTLACLTATLAANGLPIDRSAVQMLSGRGGASGIGVNAFFDGGFIVDGGHSDVDPATYLPSDAAQPTRVPPVRIRLPIPTAWRFSLLLPTGTAWAGQPEADFFAKHTPVPQHEVHESISLVYHGVVPAVESGNIAQLASALRRLHEIGFKKAELDGQLTPVRELLEALWRVPTIAAGLSSMGPLVYVIRAHDDKLDAQLVDLANSLEASLLATSSGMNHGYVLER